MKDVLRSADEFPVTIVCAIAYVTMAVVTGALERDEEASRRIEELLVLRPMQVGAGEAWRLLTSTFLHAGVVHLLVNLMTLWAIGPGLERSLGSLRFAALYLLAGLGGSLAVCLVYDPRQPVVGGSGALFGMFGAAVAMHMRAGRHTFAFLEFEGPRRLLGLIVFNLLLGLLIPVISNTAHVGGLIAGFAVTLLWLHATPAAWLRRWRLAVAAVFLAMTAWSVWPVTRFDWLVHAAATTGDTKRRTSLERVAAAAYGVRAAASDRSPERRPR